jgi:fumarylpyruvate hydrolase
MNGGWHPGAGRIWLAVNGVVKQDADLAELVWPVADIVSILSRSMELKPGDVIMTGTPAGVGAIVAGDKVVGGIDGLGEIHIAVGQPIVRRPRAS